MNSFLKRRNKVFRTWGFIAAWTAALLFVLIRGAPPSLASGAGPDLSSFQAGDLVEIHMSGGCELDPSIPRIVLGQIDQKFPDGVRVFVFWDDAGWDTDWLRALFSVLSDRSNFYQKNPPVRETIRRSRILEILSWVKTQANPDPRPPYNFEKGRLWRPEDMALFNGGGGAGVSKTMRRPTGGLP